MSVPTATKGDGEMSDVDARDEAKAADARPATSSTADAGRALRRRPPGILEPTFSGVGLVLGAFFVAVSLGPSLLPRVSWVQGIASGVSFMVGYGLGASGHAVWNYLQIPNFRRRARLIVSGILMGVIGITLGLSIWRWVGWQNEIRHTFGMPDVNPTAWPIVIGVGVLIAGTVLIASRLLRKLFRVAGHLLDRWLPRRLSIT